MSGRVFKIERTSSGERVAYVRLFAGTLRPRQRVRVGGGEEAKATSIRVFAPAGAPRRDVLAAGEMATVRGLGDVRVGDAIGEPPPGRGRDGALPAAGARGRRLCRADPTQQGSLRAALAQLAEQDPLIDVRQDDHRHEIAVSLYGEVQKEVIQATLERDYGIAADFRETTTVCIERPARVGEAEEVIRAKTKTNITGRSSPLSTNPFLATLAPADRARAAGLGHRVPQRRRGAPRPAVPVQDASRVRDADGGVRPRGAGRGLAGWQVTDCRVTMTDCGYASPATTAADFRRLTELVLLTALERAGTWVCEPLADLSLEMPASTAQAVLAASGRLGGRVRGQFSANGVTKADAVLPVARVWSLQHQLPGLSMGEGSRDAPRRLPADRRQPAEAGRARAQARSTARPGWPRWRNAGEAVATRQATAPPASVERPACRSTLDGPQAAAKMDARVGRQPLSSSFSQSSDRGHAMSSRLAVAGITAALVLGCVRCEGTDGGPRRDRPGDIDHARAVSVDHADRRAVGIPVSLTGWRVACR